jgi:hypothetical protein
MFNHFSWGVQLDLILNNLKITLSWSVCFLFWNCNLLIKLIRYSECWTFWTNLVWLIMSSNVWSRSWILLHIFLHPVRKLFLISKPKSNTLSTVRLETRIHIIARLAYILGSMSCKSICFGHTIYQNRLLKCCSTLLIKNSYVIDKLLSP